MPAPPAMKVKIHISGTLWEGGTFDTSDAGQYDFPILYLQGTTNSIVGWIDSVFSLVAAKAAELTLPENPTASVDFEIPPPGMAYGTKNMKAITRVTLQDREPVAN